MSNDVNLFDAGALIVDPTKVDLRLPQAPQPTYYRGSNAEVIDAIHHYIKSSKQFFGNTMSDIKTTSSGSVSFGGLAFLVLLVLKLTGVIDWSWWWITAPLWAGLAVVAVILAVLGLILGTVKVIAALATPRKK